MGVDDPDLLVGSISVSVSDTYNGTVTVTFEGGGDDVGGVAYLDAAKSEPHPLEWKVVDGELETDPPTEFYLEGKQFSAKVDNVEMKALLEGGDENGSSSAEDVEETTVYEVDLDIDSDNKDGYYSDNFTDKEDKRELSIGVSEAPGGKFILPLVDSDGDSIPDFVDGTDIPATTIVTESGSSDTIEKGRFIPIRILKKPPFEELEVRFTGI